MHVSPGEFFVIPRGLKYSVNLPDSTARGFICEAYSGHFKLPDRGPVGKELPSLAASLFMNCGSRAATQLGSPLQPHHTARQAPTS